MCDMFIGTNFSQRLMCFIVRDGSKNVGTKGRVGLGLEQWFGPDQDLEIRRYDRSHMDGSSLSIYNQLLLPNNTPAIAWLIMDWSFHRMYSNWDTRHGLIIAILSGWIWSADNFGIGKYCRRSLATSVAYLHRRLLYYTPFLVEPQQDFVDPVLVLERRVVARNAVTVGASRFLLQRGFPWSALEAAPWRGDLRGDVGVVHETAEPPDGSVAEGRQPRGSGLARQRRRTLLVLPGQVKVDGERGVAERPGWRVHVDKNRCRHVDLGSSVVLALDVGEYPEKGMEKKVVIESLSYEGGGELEIGVIAYILKPRAASSS